ncbi:MAG: dienelactone hydrolase family protein [Thermoanaerobaculia bacterium]
MPAGGASIRTWIVYPEKYGAVVYYGSPPDAAQMALTAAPVVGFYGGHDARITSTVPATEAEMKKNGKFYGPHVYDGAGLGFLRAQQDRTERT